MLDIFFIYSFSIRFVNVQKKAFSDFLNSISAYDSILDILSISRHKLAKTLKCDRVLKACIGNKYQNRMKVPIYCIKPSSCVM